MVARTRFMRKVNVVAVYVLCVIASTGVIASALPEFRSLQAAEDELALVMADEQAVSVQYDQQLREYRALQQDPEFLEIYGRDRLDLYKEGESVFRFSREPLP